MRSAYDDEWNIIIKFFMTYMVYHPNICYYFPKKKKKNQEFTLPSLGPDISMTAIWYVGSIGKL